MEVNLIFGFSIANISSYYSHKLSICEFSISSFCNTLQGKHCQGNIMEEYLNIYFFMSFHCFLDYAVLPGITGLALVNTIDMSRPILLAETDQKMIQTITLKNYFQYIIMTVTGSG